MAEDTGLTARHGQALATIMACKGQDIHAITAALNVTVPRAPGWTGDDRLRLIGTGPGTWLAVSESNSGTWVESLSDRLSRIASVSDQSGGYVVHRLSGPQARAILQRGAYIDLSPGKFGTGAAATTVIAHIGVIIWQIDEAPTYDIAMFRSYETSFLHWFDSVRATF